jgi:hypothetical protein
MRAIALRMSTTVLNPLAQQGIHRFTTTNTNYANSPPANVTCVPTPPNFTCSVNVLQLAANAGLISTIDPTIGTLLSDIRSSLAGVNSIFNQLANPNLQQATFFNTGSQIRKFPAVRFDFNIAKNHHLENIWNYQQFRSTVDFLNNVDPTFPGFPNFGSQDSNRFSNSTAWRWTISQNIVNEARFGLTGGSTLFRTSHRTVWPRLLAGICWWVWFQQPRAQGTSVLPFRPEYRQESPVYGDHESRASR